jgi:hypothetical protein
MTFAPQAASVSYAQIAIDQRSFHASVRLPLDEMDLLLRIDRDLDGEVSGAELEAAREIVGAYVTKHLHAAADGAALPLSVSRVALWRDAGASAFVETETEGRIASRIATVSLRSDFLTEISPAHKTQAEIRVRDRTETFVFQPGAVYERRVAADRFTSAMLVLAGLLALGALWFARRRAIALGAVLILLAAMDNIAHADVIMSAAGLNATLKTMERLTREGGADNTFRLAVEADALATLMNQEVESHGMQERALVDLALSRAKELGVGIAYNREKKKFFYDGAAFAEYLAAAPRGAHAAAAEFALLSYQFYQSTGTDVAATIAAAGAKKKFLARYPAFSESAELRLYLAVDYRDLSRTYRAANDAANAEKYRLLARGECQRLVRMYPRSEQAGAARQMLQGLNP